VWNRFRRSIAKAPDKRISDFFKPDNNIDIRAIYKMLKAKGQTSDPKAVFIGKTWAPPRVQLFIWLLLQRRIQCRAVLLTKHIVDSATCEICNAAVETPEHIIHGYSLGRKVSRRLNLQSMISMDMGQLHTLTSSTSVVIPGLPSFIALVCWQVWKARNAKVFRNEDHTVDRVLMDCKAAADYNSTGYQERRDKQQHSGAPSYRWQHRNASPRRPSKKKKWL